MNARHVVRRIKRATRGARDGFNAVAGRGTAFTHQPLGRHIDPRGVRGYYCDFRHKALDAARQPNGWPHSTLSGGPADWPMPVAQAGLGYWELGLDGHDTRDRFLAIADWFVEHADDAPGGVAWRTRIARPKYGLEPGWASAMGQGETISVLLRAHQATGRDHYVDVARAALGPLETPVEKGGVMRALDGETVLEEYPSDEPCAVLNGWIFALFGVHELANATGDARATDLFERSAASLVRLLPRYDAGWWSLYSLYDHGRPDLAKPFYQRLHPVLLKGLCLARPDARLTTTADRWESQITRRSLARVALDKLRFRAHRARTERAA